LRTVDGGRNWTPLQTETLAPRAEGTYFGIAATSDLGQSWRRTTASRLDRVAPASDRVAPASDRAAWAIVGREILVYRG
jgi:hypothetical protein